MASEVIIRRNIPPLDTVHVTDYESDHAECLPVPRFRSSIAHLVDTHTQGT